MIDVPESMFCMATVFLCSNDLILMTENNPSVCYLLWRRYSLYLCCINVLTIWSCWCQLTCYAFHNMNLSLQCSALYYEAAAFSSLLKLKSNLLFCPDCSSNYLKPNGRTMLSSFKSRGYVSAYLAYYFISCESIRWEQQISFISREVSLKMSGIVGHCM